MKNSVGKYNVSRTIVYNPDRITHAFNFVINPCHFAVDPVGERQELRRYHPNFLLCQLIQSLQSVLDLRLSQQFLQIPF